MIKHIVFFKFIEKLNPEERLQYSQELKEIFLPLKTLPSVEEYNVGVNFSESDHAWDVVIDSLFESSAKLEEYRVSDEHVAAINSGKRYKKEKSVIDYKI